MKILVRMVSLKHLSILHPEEFISGNSFFSSASFLSLFNQSLVQRLSITSSFSLLLILIFSLSFCFSTIWCSNAHTIVLKLTGSSFRSQNMNIFVYISASYLIRCLLIPQKHFHLEKPNKNFFHLLHWFHVTFLKVVSFLFIIYSSDGQLNLASFSFKE